MNISNLDRDLYLLEKMKEDGYETINKERSKDNTEVKTQRETRKTKRNKKEKTV